MSYQDLLEFVNPPKLCLALWLREHVLALRNFDRHCHMDQSGIELEMTARQRKNVCMLALKLIQDVDLPLSELIPILKNSPGSGNNDELPPFLYKAWKKHLVMLITDGGAHGLMDLVDCIEKLVSDSPGTFIRKSSVIGLFLRKLILGFGRLGFSDVALLYQNFVKYFDEGLTVLQEPDEDLIVDGDMELSSFSVEVATINKNLENAKTTNQHFREQKISVEIAKKDVPIEVNYPVLTRKQSELYISRQVDLLTSNEISADSPDLIESNIERILKHNPSLTEAHFLSYLNHLRVNEYPKAVEHLYQAMKSESHHKVGCSKTDLADENATRGYRYSALTLASLHARFGQVELAKMALREAIMLAQVTEDHACLQHVLTWLYRLRPSNKKTLIERCIAKSREYKLSYLQSLGIQSLAQTVGENGGSPTDVMTLLSHSEVLNFHHSITELVSSGFSLKSAFWSLYGRSNMSCITSQLLLLLDATFCGRSEKSHYKICEDTILALANVARQLNDRANLKECDKVLFLARSLCPSENSKWTSALSKTRIQINFERCIHLTDWSQAERWIAKANSYSEEKLEILLMKWQLAVCQGDSESAAIVCHKVKTEFPEKSPCNEVRSFILETELACLNKDYPYAVIPLMNAMKIASDHHLVFLQALLAVHVSHIQLQFGLPHRALNLLCQCLPTLMSHGSVYEMSRAKLLMAKCLVASVPKDGSAKSRKTLFEAISMLKKSQEMFSSMQAYSRAKDCLYLMALVYNSMDQISERNQCAAEFKKASENFPTNGTCQLANVL